MFDTYQTSSGNQQTNTRSMKYFTNVQLQPQIERQVQVNDFTQAKNARKEFSQYMNIHLDMKKHSSLRPQASKKKSNHTSHGLAKKAGTQSRNHLREGSSYHEPPSQLDFLQLQPGHMANAAMIYQTYNGENRSYQSRPQSYSNQSLIPIWQGPDGNRKSVANPS